MNKSDLQNFFYHSCDLLCVLDQGERIQQINPQWIKVTGHSEAELTKRPFVDLVIFEDQQRAKAAFEKIHIDKILLDFKCRIYCKDERVIWLKISAKLADQTIYLSATDITELHESQLLFDQAQEATRIGYWTVDLKTMTPFWSPMTYDIHGVPRGTKIDIEKAINFYASEARPLVNQMVKSAIERGISWDKELPFINAHGAKMWVRTTGQPKIEDGKVTSLMGVFQDITDRRDTELIIEQALEETQKFKTALDSYGSTPK